MTTRTLNIKDLARRATMMLLLAVLTTTVWAQTSASYRAYNTGTKAFETLEANNCTAVTSSTTTMGANNTVTWYVVSSNVSVTDIASEALRFFQTKNFDNSHGKLERPGRSSLCIDSSGCCSLSSYKGVSCSSNLFPGSRRPLVD